jgi:hypothetical protein
MKNGVALVRTDVLEELSPTNARCEEISSQHASVAR